MLNDPKKQAFIIIIAQLAVTSIIFILLVFVEWVAAYSALTGGLIATLTTAWFAIKVFGAKKKEPVVVLRSFYWAEINKILLTGALFVAAFVLIKPVNGAALLAVYFLVYMTPLVVDYFIQPKRRREN